RSDAGHGARRARYRNRQRYPTSARHRHRRRPAVNAALEPHGIAEPLLPHRKKIRKEHPAMTAAAKMLVIFIDETDQWDNRPLYEAIVRRLRQLGVSGATVTSGMMGFGAHLKVHHKRLFGVSDDRPAVISVVDSESTIRRVLPEIRGMVKEGLVVLLDAEVVE